VNQLWLSLIQGTAFPIVACVAMGVFIVKGLKVLKEITSDNNRARERDTKAITAALVQNTAATFELAKAIGELTEKLERERGKHER
jgi:hypothetical protein